MIKERGILRKKDGELGRDLTNVINVDRSQVFCSNNVESNFFFNGVVMQIIQEEGRHGVIISANLNCRHRMSSSEICVLLLSGRWFASPWSQATH